MCVGALLLLVTNVGTRPAPLALIGDEGVIIPVRPVAGDGGRELSSEPVTEAVDGEGELGDSRTAAELLHRIVEELPGGGNGGGRGVNRPDAERAPASAATGK